MVADGSHPILIPRVSRTVPDWSYPHNSLLSIRRFGFFSLFDLASSVILADSDGFTDTAMIVIWLLLLDGLIGSLARRKSRIVRNNAVDVVQLVQQSRVCILLSRVHRCRKTFLEVQKKVRSLYLIEDP